MEEEPFKTFIKEYIDLLGIPENFFLDLKNTEFANALAANNAQFEAKKHYENPMEVFKDWQVKKEVTLKDQKSFL